MINGIASPRGVYGIEKACQIRQIIDIGKDSYSVGQNGGITLEGTNHLVTPNSMEVLFLAFECFLFRFNNNLFHWGLHLIAIL